MFSALRDAACRFAGVRVTESSLSEDESSESDVEGKQHEEQRKLSSKYRQQQKIRRRQLMDRLDRQQEPETPIEPVQQQAASQDTQESPNTFTPLKDLLSVLPRDHLVGCVIRTLKSVDHLRDLLWLECNMQEHLQEEKKLLCKDIDHLRKRLAKFGDAQAIERERHNQLVIDTDQVKAKVEQVYEAASHYALEAASVVQRVATSNFEKKRACRRMNSARNHYRDSLTVCRRNCETQDNENGTFVSPRRSRLPPSPASVSDIDDNRNARQEAAESRDICELVDSRRRLSDQQQASPINSQECETLCNDEQSNEGHESKASCSLDVHVIPDVKNGSSEREEKRVATILEVSVILDNPPFSGSRETLRVLATDSIVDVVNQFSQQHKLTAKRRLSLIEYLETAEENADSFPAKVEVQLSELLN